MFHGHQVSVYTRLMHSAYYVIILCYHPNQQLLQTDTAAILISVLGTRLVKSLQMLIVLTATLC